MQEPLLDGGAPEIPSVATIAWNFLVLGTTAFGVATSSNLANAETLLPSADLYSSGEIYLRCSYKLTHALVRSMAAARSSIL